MLGFKIAQKVVKFLHHFCKKICHQDFTKIAQSGQTASMSKEFYRKIDPCPHTTQRLFFMVRQYSPAGPSGRPEGSNLNLTLRGSSWTRVPKFFSMYHLKTQHQQQQYNHSINSIESNYCLNWARSSKEILAYIYATLVYMHSNWLKK